MTEQILLIVEDERDIRDLMTAWLNKAFPALKIIESHTLAVGIKLALANQPRIVILDLKLPDCENVATVQHFRFKVPEPYLIVVSGSADNLTAHMALRSGADDFFAKPIERERFLERMMRAMAHSEVEMYHAPIRETIKEMREDLSKSKAMESTKMLHETSSHH